MSTVYQIYASDIQERKLHLPERWGARLEPGSTVTTVRHGDDATQIVERWTVCEDGTAVPAS